jgi:hypothetical protein
MRIRSKLGMGTVVLVRLPRRAYVEQVAQCA